MIENFAPVALTSHRRDGDESPYHTIARLMSSIIPYPRINCKPDLGDFSGPRHNIGVLL